MNSSFLTVRQQTAGFVKEGPFLFRITGKWGKELILGLVGEPVMDLAGKIAKLTGNHWRIDMVQV
jgi:hypothetical protein